MSVAGLTVGRERNRAATTYQEDSAMTTLPNRPHTALMVIDVQNGVVTGAPDRDGVVANINALVRQARDQGVPVVWVQHSDDEEMPRGSEAWDLVPELVREDSEPLVHKRYGDSFEATDLESLLAERAVGRLIVTGAESDACIRSTLHGAFTRGYDVTLVGDAHTTGDKTQWGAPPPEQVITHTNLYWRYQSAPGRKAGTVSTADVTFAPADARAPAQFRAEDRLSRDEVHERAAD
jgi:nicotinamidase-related amidase